MGLISFAKHAGRVILRRGDDEPAPAPAESTPSEAPAPVESSYTPSVETSSYTPSYSPPTSDSTGVPKFTVEMPPPSASDVSSSTADAAPAAGPNDGTVNGSGADRVYTTRMGDTLEGIAAFFYGDPAQRQRLLDENPSLAASTTSLPSGFALRVPEDAPPPAPEAPAEVAIEPAQEEHAAADLAQHIADLGLPIENLSISVSGETVTIRGVATTQADREKAVLAVGNTAGIAQVDDQIEVREPAPEATFYTVQSGDTLSAIAQAHYGDANAYMAIFEANQPMLTSPDLIYPGQVLRIPPR